MGLHTYRGVISCHRVKTQSAKHQVGTRRNGAAIASTATIMRCQTSPMSTAFNCLVYITLLLALVISPVHSTEKPKSAKSITEFMEKILSRKGYDKSARPGLDTGEITYVLVDIFINGISSVNELDMDYRVDLYLRQTWRDYRLAYDDFNGTLTLNYNQVGRLWIPDMFFRNEKSGNIHDITVPNRLLRLWPNGTILYSQRVTMTMDCQMYLAKYPMDNQTCSMIIGSYGYTTDELDFVWHVYKQPLRVKENLILPEFIITDTKPKQCNARYYTGSFACLVAEIYLKRQFEYYLLQTYVPSLLVVVLSWVSFWIDIDAVPARITLGLLTVLTMTTQASSISERLPRVSYIKAIDVWMAVCLMFVFSGLIEYSVVNVLYRRGKNKDKKEQYRRQRMLAMSHLDSADSRRGSITSDYGDSIPMCPSQCLCGGLLHSRSGERAHRVASPEEHPMTQIKNNIDDNVYQRTKIPEEQHTFLESRKKCCKNMALTVDIVSRFIFPGAFAIFNTVYWIMYTIIL